LTTAGTDGTGTPEWTATHVIMGRIGAPYGIKGWVKLVSFADPPENLLNYRHFCIADSGKLRTLEIDASRPLGAGLAGHIKGCDVREEARRYTGKELLLAKSALPELDAGYYWHQLAGLRVVNLAGDDLGVVDHLFETGANDVLVVRGDERSVDRRERLLPYVTGQVVTEVLLDAGRLLVDWGRDWGLDDQDEGRE
jgi:16S rRNA processing protein RimM